MDSYCAYGGLRAYVTFVSCVIWRVKELTKTLVLFPERVNLFPGLLFLNSLNKCISVSACCNLCYSRLTFEEITVSMNSETDSFVVVPAKTDEGTVYKRRPKLLFV